MPLASPWSRKFILQINQLGNSVYIIDPSVEKNPKSYLSDADSFQKKNVLNFIESLVGISKINTSFGYYGNLLKAIFEIKKVKKTFRPDAIVVLYGGFWGLTAYLSNVKPFILYVVGSDILLGGTIKKFITKRVLNATSQVFSNGINLSVQAKKLAPKINIKNLYFGIDTTHFSPLIEKDNSPITIVCTRGFSEIYNNQYLIDGLNELSTMNIPEIKVMFTSAGPLLEEVKEYSARVLAPKMRNCIEFLGGVSDESLKEALQKAHIYISLSLSDGASISLMEALSCGLFPVLSDIPANREWITDMNGLLTPLENPKALANCIHKAILDTKLRKKATRINRELILNKCDTIRNTEEFLNHVKDSIDNN
jgi:L-malate glycosyltransferase